MTRSKMSFAAVFFGSLVVILIVAATFIGAIFLGIWITREQAANVSPYAGQLSTTLSGSASTIQAAIDSFIKTTDAQSPTGTIYTAVVKMNLRVK